MRNRRGVMLAMVASLLSHASSSVFAQEPFPIRPVKIVVPLPPGASPDVRVRIIAEHMSGILGQRVVVENRPGAGGLLGTQAVLAAPTDGYTLLAAPSSVFTILPAQKDKLPFDVSRDLIPIGSLANEPMVLAVSPTLGVTDLQGFVERARSRPDTVVVGTNPAGSLPHLAARLLAARSNAPVLIVPYGTGGTNEALRDIMGGRVHAIVETLTALRGVLASKDLIPIAVMGRERLAAFPEVPTLSETVPGLTAVGWLGLFAPKGAPEVAVQQMGEALRATLANESIKARLAELGTPFKPLFGADLAAYIAEDQALWLPLAGQP